MDGVDEPCSPTPPTGHQHQSGHLMCYEGRTSSRALDSGSTKGPPPTPCNGLIGLSCRLMREEPMSRVHLAEKLVPLGAKVLNLITVSLHQALSLSRRSSSARCSRSATRRCSDAITSRSTST